MQKGHYLMLMKSEADLGTMIVENLSLATYVCQENKLIYLNRRFCDIFGFDDRESLLYRDLFTDIYPDSGSLDLFRGMHEKMLAEGTPHVAWAQPSGRRDGCLFWMEIEAKQVMVNGRPAIIGTFKDQTDCQIMAEAMAVSQQTLRLLLDAMEDRVYVVTDDCQIIYANRKMLETCNGNVQTDPCHKVCRDFATPCEDCRRQEVFNSGKPLYKEFFNETNQAWYSVIELGIRMPGVSRPAKLAVARDITSRKEAEQRIRALSHRLLNAQEDERKVISRELHDDLGQRLNAAKIGIETLAEDLSQQSGEVKKRLDDISKILQSSINSVRQLSGALRPSFMERLGLVEAIRDHIRKLVGVHSLSIDFKAGGIKEIKLDNETEINLYRIVQEALHNVVKHSRASQVNIRLVASHPDILLRIEDNGCGFSLEEQMTPISQGQKLGLVGMAERVDLLHGKFNIVSSSGNGTRIMVEIPFWRNGLS